MATESLRTQLVPAFVVCIAVPLPPTAQPSVADVNHTAFSPKPVLLTWVIQS